MNTINERIARVVSESKLSKTAFAGKINVSQQYISKLCRCGVPSDRTITDICREFNVNETWLRTGKDEMRTPKPEFDLGEYANQHGMTALETEILKAYLDLDPKVREGLLQHFKERLARPADQDGTQEDTIEPERTDADIAAKVAELARQNQEMAEEIAALKEEDAQLEEAERSSASIPSGRETKLA